MSSAPARRLPRLIVFVALLCAVGPAAASAATYTVDRGDDDAAATACTGAANDCSLRGALLDVEAAPGATDAIVIPAITVTLTGDLPAVNDATINLTISGAGARSTTVDANQAGRVLEVDAGAVSVQAVKLINGTVEFDGGLLLNSGGTLDVRDSALTDSHADGEGGAIANVDGTLTVTRSLIADNTADVDGPAVTVEDGTASISNSTISQNSGPYIVNSDTGEGSGTTLSYVTLSGNTVSEISTAFWFASNGPGTVLYGSVDHSIIAANNLTGDSTECDLVIPGADHVLDDDGSCVGDTPASGSATIADPLLGALGNNGGPTDTMALQPGSPALDAAGGTCPATDQRIVVTRPQGPACDVGAFEAVVAAPGAAAGGGGLGGPIVTSVLPASGPAGTTVGIDGQNLTSATQVFFGGAAATFSVDGYTHITAVAPAGGTGAVDVRVVNPVGTSPLNPGDVFTYSTFAAASQLAPTTKKLICAMPKLRRHTYRYARRLIRRAGCKAPVIHKGHAKHPPSHVKSQSPAAGKPLYDGGTIKLRLG